ncbi:MAG TPA: aldehyde dehydrogenase family protein [Casimicrobiaceae bacterium]|nr:aldehyde dehydrogenase family protein [Casimicrobiaceae bacterium]
MNHDPRIASTLAKLGLTVDPDGQVRRPLGPLLHGPLLASTNPANGRALGRVATANAEDVDRLLRSATDAARAWRDVPAPRRGDAVRRCAELLREHKDALGTLVSLENGKIKAEGDGEVQEMIDIADFAVGQSRMLYGRTLQSERRSHRMYEQWHPLGVVGVVTAFNFPVAVWAWNAMLACVCGNATVWKPSPKTPLCALAVSALADRVVEELALPPVFGLAIGGHEPGQALAADARVSLLSFTGSSAVGRSVAHTVGARFGKLLLECGGNNAVIVADDADLDLVVPSVLFGAVATAGQRCTTTRRLIVHRSRIDELLARLARAYAQVRIGDPLDPGTLMGPLIDDAAVTAYARAIDEARTSGARLVHGGKAIVRAGHFVEPTIVTAIDNTSALVQRETFAPILYVMAFDTIDEAIAMNNGVCQGLSSSLFTQSLRTAEAFLAASGSDCGIANVNIGTSGAEIGGAFGGEKETGGGRESGSDAWRAYMRRQTNTINWGRDLPLAQGIRFDVGGAAGS